MGNGARIHGSEIHDSRDHLLPISSCHEAVYTPTCGIVRGAVFIYSDGSQFLSMNNSEVVSLPLLAMLLLSMYDAWVIVSRFSFVYW